jgi:hypothetical protein
MFAASRSLSLVCPSRRLFVQRNFFVSTKSGYEWTAVVKCPPIQTYHRFSKTAENRLERKKDSPSKYLLLLLPLLAFGLGTWQVQRLDWKKKLIKEREESFQKEPLKLTLNELT